MTAKPYILAVGGSPRRHGNSETVLDAFIEGVDGAGVAVERFVVAEHAVEACRGCNACSLTGECVIHDAMQDAYGSIDGAAAIFVSSPVFFAGVPAVLKAFYDRVQPYWARQHVLKRDVPAKRPGAFALVRGGGDPFGFQAAVFETKSVFAVLGFEVVEGLKLEGVDSPGDMGKHPEFLQEVRDLGARMAGEVDGS